MVALTKKPDSPETVPAQYFAHRGNQSNWLTCNVGSQRLGLSRYRLYDVDLGIFLRRDFLRFLNKYRAWSNLPTDHVDRNGLASASETDSEIWLPTEQYPYPPNGAGKEVYWYWRSVRKPTVAEELKLRALICVSEKVGFPGQLANDLRVMMAKGDLRVGDAWGNDFSPMGQTFGGGWKGLIAKRYIVINSRVLAGGSVGPSAACTMMHETYHAGYDLPWEGLSETLQNLVGCRNWAERQADTFGAKLEAMNNKVWYITCCNKSTGQTRVIQQTEYEQLLANCGLSGCITTCPTGYTEQSRSRTPPTTSPPQRRGTKSPPATGLPKPPPPGTKRPTRPKESTSYWEPWMYGMP